MMRTRRSSKTAAVFRANLFPANLFPANLFQHRTQKNELLRLCARVGFTPPGDLQP
jgi:hypothetical protein